MTVVLRMKCNLLVNLIVPYLAIIHAKISFPFNNHKATYSNLMDLKSYIIVKTGTLGPQLIACTYC